MVKKQAASKPEKKAASKPGKSLDKKTSSGWLPGILSALPPISVTIQDWSISFTSMPIGGYKVTASAKLVFPLENGQSAKIELTNPDGTGLETVTLVDPNGTTGQPEIWKEANGSSVGTNPSGRKAKLVVSCAEQLEAKGSSGMTIP